MDWFDAAWKLVVSCALVSGCQRLEVVSDDGASATDWDDQDDDGEPAQAVCVRRSVCECYGANDTEYCDVVARELCAVDKWCGDPEGTEWAECIVDDRCEGGDGHVEGELVVCEGEPACAGRCDRDASVCDPDGDGVGTFECGPKGLECALGQWCVYVNEEVCNDECECSSFGDGWTCTDLPARCPDADLALQGECVRGELCPSSVGSYAGHTVHCNNDECIV